jgi:hypothetical protein
LESTRAFYFYDWRSIMALFGTIDSLDDCRSFDAIYAAGVAQCASNITAYVAQYVETLGKKEMKAQAAQLLAAIKDNADTAEDFGNTLETVQAFRKGLETPVPVEIPVVVEPVVIELPAPQPLPELPVIVEPTPEA